MEYKFTEAELEEVLEKAIKAYVEWVERFDDDSECATSNAISGVMEEVVNNAALSSVFQPEESIGREEFDQMVKDFQAFMQDETQ